MQKGEQFNLWAVQRDYFVRALEEVEGRKVLVLDAGTSALMSELVSQTELLGQEVYLVELLHRLGEARELDAMKTLVMVQPSAKNVQALGESLACSHLAQCYLCKRRLSRLHESRGPRVAQAARRQGCRAQQDTDRQRGTL